MAKKRVALVIGNSAYEYAGTLDNTLNDSEDMKAALEQLGFHVIHDVDLERPEFFEKLDEFAAALKGAEAGLFYYAGHGIQVAGKNYLMPIDAELSRGHISLSYEMVELDLVQKMLEAETKTSILLLDACRNNPLARNLKKGLGTRAAGEVGTGLAKIEAGYGTLIGFSTQPGGVAADKGSNGRNSPYTAALKTHILTPGEDLTSILINVRRDVVAATKREQVPWEHHNLLEKIYLGGKVEIPAGGGDVGYRARLKKQIEASTSNSELDAFKRLEPAFGPMIEARKKQLAFLKEREEEDARKAAAAAEAKRLARARDRAREKALFEARQRGEEADRKEASRAKESKHKATLLEKEFQDEKIKRQQDPCRSLSYHECLRVPAACSWRMENEVPNCVRIGTLEAAVAAILLFGAKNCHEMDYYECLRKSRKCRWRSDKQMPSCEGR